MWHDPEMYVWWFRVHIHLCCKLMHAACMAAAILACQTYDIFSSTCVTRIYVSRMTHSHVSRVSDIWHMHYIHIELTHVSHSYITHLSHPQISSACECDSCVTHVWHVHVTYVSHSNPFETCVTHLSHSHPWISYIIFTFTSTNLKWMPTGHTWMRIRHVAVCCTHRSQLSCRARLRRTRGCAYDMCDTCSSRKLCNFETFVCKKVE